MIDDEICSSCKECVNKREKPLLFIMCYTCDFYKETVKKLKQELDSLKDKNDNIQN